MAYWPKAPPSAPPFSQLCGRFQGIVETGADVVLVVEVDWESEEAHPVSKSALNENRNKRRNMLVSLAHRRQIEYPLLTIPARYLRQLYAPQLKLL